MTEEEKYIITQFKENIIGHYHKIAIYGIGKNTELILNAFPGAPIAGLLDSAYDGQELFGKRMLAEDEIIKEQIDVIVIVARKSVQGIIYPRIEKYEGGGYVLLMSKEKMLENEKYVWSLIFRNIQWDMKM